MNNTTRATDTTAESHRPVNRNLLIAGLCVVVAVLLSYYVSESTIWLCLAALLALGTVTAYTPYAVQHTAGAVKEVQMKHMLNDSSLEPISDPNSVIASKLAQDASINASAAAPTGSGERQVDNDGARAQGSEGRVAAFQDEQPPQKVPRMAHDTAVDTLHGEEAAPGAPAAMQGASAAVPVRAGDITEPPQSLPTITAQMPGDNVSSGDFASPKGERDSGRGFNTSGFASPEVCTRSIPSVAEAASMAHVVIDWQHVKLGMHQT